VHTQCSGFYLGVHGSGVGVGGGVDGSVKAHPGGRKVMALMLGRDRQDVYLPIQCVGEVVVHWGSYSAKEVCFRIVDMVNVMVLRSVH
jgi:hypothetical protein